MPRLDGGGNGGFNVSDDGMNTKLLAAVHSGEPEAIVGAYMAAKARVARDREFMTCVEDAILEHIGAHGGAAIVVGTLELRATFPKETKGRKGAAGRTLAALLEATAGDVQAVADCLYADPFKVSSAKAILPGDTFADCFETIVRPKLVEGVAKKQLVCVDTQYLPERK